MICDPAHRCWNDVKNGLQAAGLWALVLEYVSRGAAANLARDAQGQPCGL